MQRNTLLVTALVLCTASSAMAQEKMIKIKPMQKAKQEVKEKAYAKKLTIGDKAPSIDITHWVKGKEVKEFESDKVYVVEFWATWCGPCVSSMPHLSELQEKYADYGVNFISVSNEPLETVVSFLFKEYKGDGKIHNDRTHYTLTTDPDQSVMNDYFRAAGQTGIPCAFIVGKDAKIEWIGHPMAMDDPLEAVVKDTWDRNEAKIAFETSMENRRKAAAKRQADAKAAEAKGQTFAQAMQSEDWAPAVKMSWENANSLNAIAWTIADTQGVKNRDFDIALKAAKRATKLTNEKDAAILDTLARVYYETGDLKAAIKWQSKAVESIAGEGEMADGIRAALKKYKKEAGADS